MQAYNPENDPLLAQARGLLDTAVEAAAAAYDPMCEQFPSLDAAFSKAYQQGRWGLIVTIACVYIAAARLQNLALGEARELALMNEVSAHLEAWDAEHARACFENCKEFFGPNYEGLAARGLEQRYLASDTIGIWIAWNILGHGPQTDDEVHFVRTIGVALTHGFFGWWTIKS
ncbi:MAG: hypothetical protein ACYCZX_12465 [Rhodospirillaceae bacterium]